MCQVFQLLSSEQKISINMNKNIYRNIAIVTAAFSLALAVMLGVSWWQSRQASPLQTEVMTTLKELNESNPDIEQLGEEIRQLDLLSRRAYFTQERHMVVGLWILLGMLAILAVCLRMYHKDTMHLPDKDMHPIDEWMSKSQSRKYLGWGIGVAACVALVAIVANSSLVSNWLKGLGSDSVDSLSTVNTQLSTLNSQPEDTLIVAASPDTARVDSTLLAEEEEAEQDSFPIPKITSNAFRGNNSLGRSSARGIPTSWSLSGGTHVAWRKEVPKHGYSSPVVNGRNIFVTGADQQARELYCFDLYTGELKWTAKADGIAGSPSSMPKVNEDTGLAASTVATNGKVVCAIFATGDIMGVDMDGKRLWAKNLGVPDNHYGYASSLLMYGNELIVQYDNNSGAKLIALNASNGGQLWSKSRTDKIAWSSPIIAQAGGVPAIIVMGNPAITAYNPSNGQELWRVECMSGEVGASPCANGDIIYGASEYATVVAIDGKDGTVLWEASDCMPECSSPVATKDLLYVATSYGAVCAYNTEDGTVVKQHELTTPFYSSPVVVDGKVYLFSNSGKCYIFSAGKDFNLINSFDTGEHTYATPAFTDGMMVVRTDKSLYVVKN